MMDPELMRLAQEQMSRMSPADFAKIQQQVMANPDLIKMASESMKGIRPDDLKYAAEQLKHTSPEDMAKLSEKMANASPEELATMHTRADALANYELNAAEMLKTQGNKLHSQGRFSDALEKYLLAKKNLKGISSSKGKTLLLACSLNLMSCYLKTKQYQDCIREGCEVLAYDSRNVKALYRRGQAYKELCQFHDAVSDLSKAREISPDDETIADVLSDAKERLKEHDVGNLCKGIVIEEIVEEDDLTSKNISAPRPQGVVDNSKAADVYQNIVNAESLQELKDDPEAIRSFQRFVSNADPNTLAAMSFGKPGEVSPDMIATASNMISKMSPDELQEVLKLASSFQEANPLKGNGFGPNLDNPNMTPELVNTASRIMSSMPPDDVQKMFEIASSLKRSDNIPDSDTRSNYFESHQSNISGSSNMNNTSSYGAVSNCSSNSTIPTSSDMQEQMRNQMKNPAMQQMFTSMIKNMSPEMMANMSEQFGVKLSPEDAAKAQEAISSLSPQDLDKMMRWADKIQKGVEGGKKAKNWLLGRPGMILAICMLILAVILHRFGIVGG
ncbi:outer envelope protein 61-like [Cucurbita maxima]|uniref:Outer envelope protein 61-like n=1 Tax=Cucurbita maxima TaxID=3661 RepID=A0A6J1K8C3_CUCMA|nr:outer envelope protein 61-like [Cucurbita maxima]XP_022996305.1 outer envelope protein 61-like [Cucurbita maxima]XP_022996306.1 outer envelope protein 61-like [Cucurbita maxima]